MLLFQCEFSSVCEFIRLTMPVGLILFHVSLPSAFHLVTSNVFHMSCGKGSEMMIYTCTWFTSIFIVPAKLSTINTGKCYEMRVDSNTGLWNSCHNFAVVTLLDITDIEFMGDNSWWRWTVVSECRWTTRKVTTSDCLYCFEPGLAELQQSSCPLKVTYTRI